MIDFSCEELTEVFSSLQTFDDAPVTNAVWSKPVIHVVPCEPSMLVGMKEASIGSNEPNSTMRFHQIEGYAGRADLRTDIKFIDGIREWYQISLKYCLVIFMRGNAIADDNRERNFVFLENRPVPISRQQ